MLVKFLSLPRNVCCDILAFWLVLRSIAKLDSEFCNHVTRDKFVDFLSSKELVHHNPVYLRIKIVPWLNAKSLRLAEVIFDAETECSLLLIHYFGSFGDTVRSVHFHGPCNEMEMMYLIACWCKYLSKLCCSKVSLSYAFHAILVSNPNLREMWVQQTACLLGDLMKNLTLHKLELLAVKSVDCSEGFPWSGSTFSNNLQRVECSYLQFYRKDIVALLQNCMSIRCLSFEGVGFEDKHLREFLVARPEVINLDISNNELITDSSVLFVAENLPCLRALNVQKCQSLSSASLLHIADFCHTLEVLYCDITDASDATERIVKEFSQKCTNLAFLNICSNFILCTTTCTWSLLEGCPALHILVINDFNNITPSGRKLSSLLKPHLKILVHDECTEYNVLTLPI